MGSKKEIIGKNVTIAPSKTTVRRAPRYFYRGTKQAAGEAKKIKGNSDKISECLWLVKLDCTRLPF